MDYRNTGRVAAGLAAMLLAAAAGGCDTLGYLGYLMAPEAKKVKVPPEYEGLTKRKVAVVIYADQQVQYEYPYARLGLSAALNSELKKHLEGAAIVDPRRVIRYQDDNVHWDTMDKTTLGQAFEADAVLYVILEQYSMREPGSISLFRGQISAQARVYDVSLPESQALVWQGDDFAVIYPEHAPVGELGEDDSKVRFETEKQLAAAIVGRFYEREVPVE